MEKTEKVKWLKKVRGSVMSERQKMMLAKSVSVAGINFKNVFVRLAAQTPAATATFKKLGVSMQEISH